MEPNIFRFIWRHSTRQQLQLLLLTGLAFPFLYWSLNIPKTIINEALGGGDVPYVVEFLGLSVTMDQIEYLLTLCFLFLALVLINGGFKYVINVYGGVIGERMLRRLRYQLFEHVLRFPTPHFRKVGQGEVVSMVVAETEPLGGFMGDAIKLPAFQGGQLLVIVAFMFAQDPILGAAAIALYPVQAWFIPKLQKRVNELKKEMVVNRRRLSEHIGEVVDGVQEIHAHDTSEFELAGFSQRMSQMFRIRLEIFKRKFMIKFLNNFMAQITPFFFYSIGGYLVIQESLTVGALVAVLAAYERINSPWKELLTYYQQMEDARIRYDLLSETFQPVGMLPYEQQRGEPPQEDGRIPALVGEYIASNVDLRDEPDSGSTQAVSFQLDLAATQAFV
ncbi:MAG: ABC transporter ATP-binding protein, partial [Pseudomonadota bacterium]